MVASPVATGHEARLTGVSTPGGVNPKGQGAGGQTLAQGQDDVPVEPIIGDY